MIAADDIDTTLVPRARPEVATVELDGEAVLYDERTGSTHVLNSTGTVVWGCFDGTAPLADLIDELAEAYGAPRAAVETDVLSLARRLGASGLLEGVAGTDAAGEQPPQDEENCGDD